MAARTNKLVSLGVVTLGIAYGCYPYVTGAHIETARIQKKMAGPSPSSLTPDLPPLNGSDPFRLTASVKARPSISTKEPVRKPEPHKPAMDVDSLRASLVLEATCVKGAKRWAMINGRLYAEGATFTVGGSAETSVLVKHVEIDHVVLRTAGQELILRYGMRSRSLAPQRQSNPSPRSTADRMRKKP
jgi:hypothetical protein